jgi:hypothetical protein
MTQRIVCSDIIAGVAPGTENPVLADASTNGQHQLDRASAMFAWSLVANYFSRYTDHQLLVLLLRDHPNGRSLQFLNEAAHSLSLFSRFCCTPNKETCITRSR